MTASVVALVWLAAQQAPPPNVPAPAQACAVSRDPTYGFTRENPVQIGGGALYARSREERYLNALRGPNGEPLRFKRTGSGPQTDPPTALPDGGYTILDFYEVTYEGLAKPLRLYLDAYHFWDPRAPTGLTCAQPFALRPILDEFAIQDALSAAAADQHAREFAPIPLGADGSAAHGVLWDGFRMMALAARKASADDRRQAAATALAAPTMVLAYPLSCDGKTIRPVAIDLVRSGGTVVPRDGEYLEGRDVAAALPGPPVPAGSLAARFRMLMLGSGNSARITYAEPACPQGTTTVVLPLTFAQAQPTHSPAPRLPEGADPEESRVLLQVLIDLDGRLQRVRYMGGPAQLEHAAIEAAKEWRVSPARVNGAPVPTPTLVEIRFQR